MKRFLKSRYLPGVVVLVLLLSLLGVQTGVIQPQVLHGIPSIGVGNRVITLGTTAEAAGTADFVCTGVADDAQFTLAINALPPGGGRLVVLPGTYNFTATVTKAMANVTIEGTGQGTYFTFNTINPIFTAGGNNWVFLNLRTDAGGINMGATTGWMWTNITINATYYAYRSPYGQSVVNDLTAASVTDSGLTSSRVPVAGAAGLLGDSTNLRFDGSSLQISGANVTRAAAVIVAASNAVASVKAQADFVADAVSGQTSLTAAYAALPTATVGGDTYKVGTIHLSSGVFNFSANATFDGTTGIPFAITIEGEDGRRGGASAGNVGGTIISGDNITLLNFLFPAVEPAAGNQSSLVLRNLTLQLDTKTDISGVGLLIQNLALSVKLENVTISGAYSGWRVLNGLQFVTVNDSNFTYNTTGINWTDGTSYGLYRATFLNTSFYQNTYGGYLDCPNFESQQIYFGPGCNFERNTFGMALTRPEGVFFVGNVFENNGVTASSVGADITLVDYTGAAARYETHNLGVRDTTVVGYSLANTIPFIRMSWAQGRLWGIDLDHVIINRPGGGGTVPPIIQADNPDWTPAQRKGIAFNYTFKNVTVTTAANNQIGGTLGGVTWNGVTVDNRGVTSNYWITPAMIAVDGNGAKVRQVIYDTDGVLGNTEVAGTAIIHTGATAVDVTHGLAYTPTAANVQVTSASTMGNTSYLYTGNFTATIFTIYANVDPATANITAAYRVNQ
ncbi:MAG: hypothetical protein PHQ43_11395 [Dehalococcoidales bacterium]|nr:hypothetical protein [Dehalococcoidales bacterium]